MFRRARLFPCKLCGNKLKLLGLSGFSLQSLPE
jgi:hypothetical protein